MKIIYEDPYILAIEKPVGVSIQKDKTNEKDVISLISENTNIAKDKIGIVHRLDKPVGGLVVFSKTKEALINLNNQIKNREIEKSYLAIICGTLKGSKEIKHFLLKNERLNMSKVVQKNTNKAKEASLFYESLNTIHTKDYGDLTLVKIKLITGRHNQIRVQFSHLNLPLFGDRKYNKKIKSQNDISVALWSYGIKFTHPIDSQILDLKLYPDNIYPFDIKDFNQKLL